MGERKAPIGSGPRPVAATARAAALGAAAIARTAGATRLAVAATAVAALVVFGVGLPPAGGTAAAAECEWQPHKVRVVKHVKLHGKRVKVVRKRVRWRCVAVPGAPAPVPTAAAPATPAPAPTPEPAPPSPPVFSPEDLSNPHFLGAQAYEFGFTPTKPGFELQAGADTIELINTGEDAHDLHLESLATHATVLEVTPTGSGGHARASAVLEPGEYRLYCSLGNHAEEGMDQKLTVTP